MTARSAIWNFFTEKDDNSDKATCNSCGSDYSCKNGTTSSLINHLKSKHKEIHQQFMKTTSKRPAAPSTSSKPKTKQAKLEDCIPQNADSLNRAIEDAIVDFLSDSGVAFRVVGLASFKKLMEIANRRIKLKHPKTYARLVKAKAADIKQDLLDIIAAVKGDLGCVGFTTDMWTSISGNPFMSLTVHFIDKDWVLHRFTPYVAPFPARHTGKNISLGLDAMVEDLGLDTGDWELFSVNDNAANVKLGIKLSLYLKQYLCDIHTLELAVKDTFKNTLGMNGVLIKTKALGKFTHKSTVATNMLQKEAIKENVKFRKIANPPNTRWSGKFDNLASVLHLKKPLMNLMAGQDDWTEHELSAGDWKLIEGAVTLLKPVRDTVKVLETEKEPTMHRVIERVYSMHTIIDSFIAEPTNNKHGIGFARQLKLQIENRFPNTGTDNKLRRIANYLAPQYKGMHLEATDKFEATKDEIRDEANILDQNEREPEAPEEIVVDENIQQVPLSPTSQLRKKMLAKQRRPQDHAHASNLDVSPVDRELRRYESFSLAPKTVDVLQWWRSHENVLPILSKLAKKVLTVPASSSKSERVFSCGGNFVTPKRNKLGAKKVEELILIKENKSQIEEFKNRGSYQLEQTNKRSFDKISVDQVLANLVRDEEDEAEQSDSEHDEQEEVLFFINGDSDVDTEDDETYDEVEIDSDLDEL
jgi:hypothetical protein